MGSDKLYWFRWDDNDAQLPDRDYYRQHAIYELPEELLKTVLEMRDDFRHYVGHHCDYNEHGVKNSDWSHPEKNWQMFYDKWDFGVDHTKLVQIGIYREG